MQGLANLETNVPESEALANQLRNGQLVSDLRFDRFLPVELQTVSSQYWTPLAVCIRVAQWVNELGIRNIVDIGSGAGKFCVATALATSIDVVGVEHRSRLSGAARDLAQIFGVSERVTIVDGAFTEVLAETLVAEAYYLFNLFGECLADEDEYLDQDVELGQRRYDQDVASTLDLLLPAPLGTIVFKYNGFGAQMPDAYKQIREDNNLPKRLCAWRKSR
jgi:hypothetical protein